MINRRSKLRALGILLVCHVFCSQSIAGTVRYRAIEPDNGILDAEVNLKTVGPLQISDGLVTIKRNQIAVLSDASDPALEAELTGEIFDPHVETGKDGSAVSGVALFTKGFSITALEDAPVEESIQSTDGSHYVGRIIDMDSSQVRIKTASGIKTLSIRSVAAIKSRRAYIFSIPLTSGTIGTDTNLSAQSALISFSPTYTVFDAVPLSVPKYATTLQGQLTEKHTAKRLIWAAAATAGVAACFAIPIVIAITTPHQLSDIQTVIKTAKAAKKQPAAAAATVQFSDRIKR